MDTISLVMFKFNPTVASLRFLQASKHASLCKEGVDWENAKIVAKEAKWTQRKFLEGIETLKEKNKGIHPLNSFNKMEQWQSTIYSFIELE